MTTLRKTKLKGWYEYYRELCPICHHSGGCMIHEDGEKVVCIRSESEVLFSNKFPMWLHYLVEKKKVDKQKHIEGNSKASDPQLNAVYTSLLNCLTLETQHSLHLQGASRGMAINEIVVRGYKSSPENSFATVRKMSEEVSTDYLKGVPGFYEYKSGVWGFLSRPGILIPYRNNKNQIIGMQLRVDNPPNDVEIDKGSFHKLRAFVKEQPGLVHIYDGDEFIKEVELEVGGSYSVYHNSKYGFVTLKKGKRYFWVSSANKVNGTGAGDPLPVHIAVPTNKLKNWNVGEVLKEKAVWITEGALKADIAAEHIERAYSEEQLQELGSTVIGIPGINTWRYLLPVLKEMEVGQVNLAIDMDLMTNPEVAKHSIEFLKELRRLGLKVNMVMWNEEDGKGLDDIFIVKRMPQIRAFQ